MARLRRRVVMTRRIPIRFVETTTRAQTRQVMADMLTPELIARGFRLSPSRKVWNDDQTKILAYEYDITALI